MALRRFKMASWVTYNDSDNSSCVWHESSVSNASNSGSSKVFSFPPPSRASTSKSPLSKRWNHSRHVLSLREASPWAWEHSINLSQSDLQMKGENQNFPQMTRIWLENWHLRSRINLWYNHKFTKVALFVMLTDVQAYCVTFLICLFRLALTAAAIYQKTSEAKLYT